MSLISKILNVKYPTIPFLDNALFWINGRIFKSGSNYYFYDKSGNGRHFLITNYDFDTNWNYGFPYKSSATISAPTGDSTLIAEDVNNYLYDSGGNPNQIPVVSLFQDINYANKLFSRHIEQRINSNNVEVYQPRIVDIVLYDTIKTNTDLNECQSYYSVPTELISNIAWIDPVNGNNTTGNGSKSLPYLTFAKAITTVTTGGTIYIKNGSLTEICAITNISLSVIGTGLVKNTNATRSYSITSTGSEVINIKNQILSNTTHSIRSYGISGILNIISCKLTASNTVYGGIASSGNLVLKYNLVLNPMIVTITTITVDTNYIKPVSGIAIRSYYNLVSKNNKYDTNTSLTTLVQRQANTTSITFLGDILIGSVLTDEAITQSMSITFSYCYFYQTSSNVFISLVNTTNNVTFNINYSRFIQTGTSTNTCIILRGSNISVNDCIFTKSLRFNAIANSSGKSINFYNNICNSNSEQFITITDYESNIYNNIIISETSSRINITSNSYSFINNIYGNYIVSQNSVVPFVVIGTEYNNTISGRLNGSKVYNNRFIGPSNFGNSPNSMHGLFVWSQSVEWYNNYLSGTFLGFVAKSNGATYENIFHHNIVTNCSMSYTVKGIKGCKVYNNISYLASFFNALAEVYTGSEGDSGYSIVKNNIVYENNLNTTLLTIENSDQLIGCDFDNNVYYNSLNVDIAEIVNTKYDLSDWQLLGYDTNSLFQNPNLVNNLYPISPFSIGENLGVDYDDGLDISTNWGETNRLPRIVTKQQSGTWQIGAYIL